MSICIRGWLIGLGLTLASSLTVHAQYPAYPSISSPSNYAVLPVGKEVTVKWTTNGGAGGTSWALIDKNQSKLATASSSANAVVTSGDITWTPSANQAGDQTLAIQLCNGDFCMTGQAIVVTVVDGSPGKPVLSGLSTVALGSSYQLSWSRTQGFCGTSWQLYKRVVEKTGTKTDTKVGDENALAACAGSGVAQTVSVNLDTSGWTVGGNSFFVRLIRKDGEVTGSTDSDVFTVTAREATPGQASLADGWSNAVVTKGTSYSVAWSTLGNAAKSGSLIFDGTEVASFTLDTAGKSGSLTWKPSASTGGSYKSLSLKLCNGSTCTDGQTYSVQVTDGTPGKPTLSGLSTVTLGSSYQLSWSRTQGFCGTSWQLYKRVGQTDNAYGPENTLAACAGSGVAQSVSVTLESSALTKGSNAFVVRLYRKEGDVKAFIDSDPFTVTVNESVVITPVLTAPKLTSNSSAIATGGTVTFTWTAPKDSYKSWQLRESGNAYLGGAISTSGDNQSSSMTVSLNTPKDFAFSVRTYAGTSLTGDFRDSNEVLIAVRDAAGVAAVNKPVVAPPGTGVIFGSDIPISWSVVAGGAPDTTRLYVDKGVSTGQTLEGTAITKNTSGWSGSFTLKSLGLGSHTLQVELCNTKGCVLSDAQTLTVVANTANLAKPTVTSAPPSSMAKGGQHLLKWEAATIQAVSWQVFNGAQSLTDLQVPVRVSNQTLQRGEVGLVFGLAQQYKLTIKLCDAQSQCVSSDEKIVNVTDGVNNSFFPPTKPTFLATSSTTKVGQALNFTWTSNDNLTPLTNWSIKQGATVLAQENLPASTQKNYSKTFPLSWLVPGSNDLVASVCNANGCTNSEALTINVTTVEGQSVGGVPDRPEFDATNVKRVTLGEPISLGWAIKANGLKGDYWKYLLRGADGYSELTPSLPIDPNSPATSKRSAPLVFNTDGTKSVLVRTCLVDKCADSAPFDVVVAAPASTTALPTASAVRSGLGNASQVSTVNPSSSLNSPLQSNAASSASSPMASLPIVNASRSLESMSLNALPPDAVASLGGARTNPAFSFSDRRDDQGPRPPGKPLTRPLSGQAEARYSTDNWLTLQWSRAEGEVATDWSLLIDGNPAVNRQSLAPQQIQSGYAPVPKLTPGQHTLVVQLCNSAGCTLGDAISLEVQGSALQATQRAPDPPLILANTQWASDRVMVHWRSGDVPGDQVDVMINGRSMEGRMAVRSGMGQSGSHSYFYQGDFGVQQAVVTVLLCNAYGCTTSQPYTIKRFGF
jgi:Chitinase A, N-terminal domain